jgi:quinol monooxygenase YgiN
MAMITEIATLTIDPATSSAFEAAVAEAAPSFKADPACNGMTLERWDSVEAHMAFRETPAFQTWRGLAGPFFVAPPVVVHSETVGSFF